jgi:hypothetical protein
LLVNFVTVLLVTVGMVLTAGLPVWTPEGEPVSARKPSAGPTLEMTEREDPT